MGKYHSELLMLLSSPELKDEIKKSSSPEPLSQFQPNLAQNIFGWVGFMFLQIKKTIIYYKVYNILFSSLN